jgi:hypothetical protein
VPRFRLLQSLRDQSADVSDCHVVRVTAGSGKTSVFLRPLYDQMLHGEQRLGRVQRRHYRAEVWFDRVLSLFPREWLDEFGSEMLADFRDRCRDHRDDFWRWVAWETSGLVVAALKVRLSAAWQALRRSRQAR